MAERDSKGRFKKGSSGFTGRHSVETRRKISENRSEYPLKKLDCGCCSKMIITRTRTKRFCSVVCRNIFYKGKRVSPRTEFKKGSSGFTGKHSEETKKMLSEMQKGKRVGKDNHFFGKKHSKEHRLKMSLAAKRNWEKPEHRAKMNIEERRAKQVFPLKDSSIEVAVQEWLKELGVDFFTHQYMKIDHGYQCDVLVPSLNLVIECDGDYWHKYPVGREIDRVRTSELIEKGFKVLRLWEHEIKEMSLDDFKKKMEGDVSWL